jgi:hypothetical protein
MPLNKITVASLASNTITGVAIANGTIESVDLSNTGVSASTYGGASSAAVVTIDSTGRITYAANVAISGETANPLVFTAIGT